MVTAGAEGGETGELLVNEYSLGCFSLDDKKGGRWELDGVMVAEQCKCTSCH